MSTTRRRTIMIDQEVQGALILRAIIYWFYCLLSVTLMVLCWTIFHGPRRPFSDIAAQLLQEYAPAIGASLILVPMIIVDIVRFSNLFVGPVYRLRRAMDQVATGKTVHPLSFREEDFWAECADSFNNMLERLQQTAGPEAPRGVLAEQGAIEAAGENDAELQTTS